MKPSDDALEGRKPKLQDEAPSSADVEINADTDISTIPASTLYDMNQELYENSVTARPLVDGISPMSVLREEYERGKDSFVKQIDGLVNRGFTHIRRTKGDGDCFYRSIAFAYVEQILHAADRDYAASLALSTLQATLAKLDAAGFHTLVYEDFYAELEGIIQQVSKPNSQGKLLDSMELLRLFQSAESSNAIVMYLRLLTSAEIRTNPDDYTPFLYHPECDDIILSPREFCEAFVEAMGREADHVQITALTKALSLSADIAYLDGRTNTAEFVEFRHGEGDDAPPLCLLYRPGHYDVLTRQGELETK